MNLCENIMNYIKIPEYSSYPYHDNKSKFIAIVHCITNTIQTINKCQMFYQHKTICASYDKKLGLHSVQNLFQKQ